MGYKGIALGGITGSEVTGYRIENPMNDWVYAYLVKRMGLISGIVILTLIFFVFVLLYMTGKSISYLPYPSRLVRSFAIWYAVSSLYMILGCLNLVPMTGVPIPFLSSSGTALLIWTTIILFCALNAADMQELKKYGR